MDKVSHANASSEHEASGAENMFDHTNAVIAT